MIPSRLHRAASAVSGHRCRHRHYTRSLASARSTHLKTKPFFDQVDEQMKQDYPEQYERYTESKRAYKLRKQYEEARVDSFHVDAVSPVPVAPGKKMMFQERNGNMEEKMSKSWSLDHQGEQNEVPWDKQIEQQQDLIPSSQVEETIPIAETPKKEDNMNRGKKSSIFSSISKSALSFQDGDSSTTIPLAELFPTLYAKESSSDYVTSSSVDTTRAINPEMMYDTRQFDAYREAMTAVMSHEKMQRTLSKFEKKDETNVQLIQRLKEWVLSDHRVIDTDVVGDRWKNLEKHWREGWMVGGASSLMEGSDNEPASNVMKSELKAQNQLFQSTLLHDADGENDQDGARDPQTFNQIAQLLFTALGRYCAERARSVPMEVAWYKIKESGLVLPKDTISTYLYVVGTMGMGDSFRMTSGDEEKKDSNESSISEEVVTYHDLAMKPSESSISLRVKAFASKGDAKTAQELLEAFKKTIDDDDDNKEAIRLRTYLPILKQYCESNDVGAALAVFKQMQSISTVILEPENYVLLLASIAENGYFCKNSPPIQGISDLGLDNESGPELFNELVSEMADDVLEISSASASRLHNALAVGFKGRPENNLKEMHPLASMPVSRQPAESNEVVACRISLDRSSGICPVTNAQQRLLVLEPSQRRQLHDDLLSLSRDQFVKFAGKREDESPERAAEELQKFSDWLDDRDGEPFTAILDGANIGYYMQSFDKGRFNYHQIKFMVDTLEERGENVLVVIPNKYGYNSFYTSKAHHQQLDAAERTIMNDLLRRKKLYKVPPRCLDDFYWMLASVSDQVSARKGVDLSVPNDDPSGRWPGVRPVLISNDQMRDHKWELLEPRLFRRWYGCHIVNYNFTAFVMDECVDGNEVFFSQADFFSREIQGNPSGCGKAWHFPVSDWDLEDRFVVRL
eukprot:scaffold2736_cov212-Skeletonema_menzelii.AAC.3